MQSNTQSVPPVETHTAVTEQPVPAQAVAAQSVNGSPDGAQPVVPCAALPPVGVSAAPAHQSTPESTPKSTPASNGAAPSTPKPSVQSTPAPTVLPTLPIMNGGASGRPVQPVAQAVVEPQKRQWLNWAGYTVLALLVAGGAGGYGTYASWRGGEHIAPQFFIQGEPVGGLTRLEARRRLEQRFGKLVLTVQTPHRPFMLTLEEWGGKPQINEAVNNAYWYGRSGNPFKNVWKLWQARGEEHRLKLPVEWDKDKLRRTMWTVATQYQTAPREATLKVGEKGAEVVPHQEGRSINVGATLQNLQRGYFTGLPMHEAIVRTVMPRITSADLAGTDMKLGEYRTYFDSGLGGRTKNIRIAASALDGRVLMPDEQFSFNETTGERTSSKGYRIAHIFVRKPGEAESEVVDGLGGGVCQVSSTLFNAVRRARRNAGNKLRILELNHHSLPVSYVPYGLDATVAWPHKDFKFRNNFSHPIYLRATVSGSRLYISVWGRVPANANDSSVASATQATGPKPEQIKNS